MRVFSLKFEYFLMSSQDLLTVLEVPSMEIWWYHQPFLKKIDQYQRKDLNWKRLSHPFLHEEIESIQFSINNAMQRLL